MVRNALAVFALVLSSLTPVLPAAAAPVGGPRAFIEQVYRLYRSPDFNPFDEPDRYFTPQLAKAMDDDATIDPSEVGILDYDPFCQCQDNSGMYAKVRAVTQRGGKADPRTPSLRAASATLPVGDAALGG